MIRLATKDDMSVLLEIYEKARQFMASTGNANQWVDGYPNKQDLEVEIALHRLYVLCIDDEIEASFVFYNGIDPCYNKIYDGAWLNDKPYGVLHKVATRQRKKHMGDQIISFAFSQNSNIRIDTHEMNLPMQHLLEKHGFQKTGTIYLENGHSRWAYHGVKDCNFV